VSHRPVVENQNEAMRTCENQNTGESMKTRRRLPLALLSGLGLLALAGCAKDAPQDTWQPAGPNAEQIDNLQQPVFLVAGIVGIIVFAAVAWVIVRYRDKGQAIPEQTHGKPALEITLTVIPVLILIGVAIPTAWPGPTTPR
jgi:cytochrome c oxidase subunit II